MRSKIAAGILLIVFTPALSSLAQSTDRAKYIGYEYKGVVPGKALSNGVKHLGGGLIGNIDADPVYGIAQVEKGKVKMFWLEESTGRDESGVTGWRVKDVLSFPNLATSDYIFFAGDPAIECTKKGDAIPNLVGVGRIIRRQWAFRPSKLWVANLTSLKFEPFSITGVKCQYSEP